MNIIQELQSRIDKTSHEISEAIALGYWNDISKEQQKEIVQRQTLDKRLMARCIWDERLRVLYVKLLHKYSKVVAENVRLKGTFKEAREAE